MQSQEYINKTGDIYGSLFTNYDDKLFDESVELFFKRHKLWKIDLNWFKNKICLDAGCGGGRFVVALSMLGAKEVRGIDIGKDAVSAANDRLAAKSLKNAGAQVGSVLDINFPSDYFDYVICSGVIHHTPNPKQAFGELVRVLKPGGKFFLSVYGKGGLKWLANDLFRYTICKLISFHGLETLFKFIGVPANKRYNILDNLYVPYCYRYTEKEVGKWLTDAGFENLQRVKFERYDYQTLKSRIIHGEGWIQIYADKKV
ncbi:methyltransferase domain-containing protein [Candidatus Wolfebacteria bacterium]|nr:methyltransferase domain-containing protein [Candidatus Wolfebacteria bacterium]